jgi:hypothetical protein
LTCIVVLPPTVLPQVKNDIIQERMQRGDITGHEYWKMVEASDTKRAAFSRVLQLARVMFIVAVNTAVVERGFSLHKHIKSAKRSRLHTATVDSLMRVALLSGDNTMVLGANYTQSTLVLDAGAALPFYEADDSLVKRLHQQLSNIEVSDEVLEADSAAAGELAGVLLSTDDLVEGGNNDGEGGESEGSELSAEDAALETELQRSWQLTLEQVGLAMPGDEGGDAADEAAAAAAAAASGQESDSESLGAAMGWGDD